MKLDIFTVTGEHAITLEDGQAVYDRIKPELAAEQPVELDFAGVNVFASPFFNAAVGQLVADFSADTLNRLLRVTNINPVGDDVMRQVIKTSKQFYSMPNYREAQQKVLQAMAEES